MKANIRPGLNRARFDVPDRATMNKFQLAFKESIVKRKMYAKNEDENNLFKSSENDAGSDKIDGEMQKEG